ncbi:NRDE family protein [Paraburkholderia pallida]|uniref:NRDE family protein n=1 Tax=Paraburkholderia pallida TaxID=2547399 RepID=A0A4P7CRC3_9BURK|nr:NRDE family protein [Paraburkholderia pallida]QBQ97557.1 NRDE family protein [Paraburkholderia pallida]
MCLIVFDWRPHAADGALFTLAANRDEFLRRTAEPMQWWKDAPGVLAGRDLVGGGTWLGMTRDGLFAALTNYRAPHEMRPDAPTRGTLVSRWLTGPGGAEKRPDTPLDYLEDVARDGEMYNGFNLVVGDWKRRELAWYCNRGDRVPALLPEGTHGISNAVLDTPWPKLVRKRAGLAQLTSDGPDVPLEQLISLMRDPGVAPDSELPATGIPLERERALSAAFIETPEYGTRGTTALRVRVNGDRLNVEARERSDDDGSHRIARPGAFERHECFTVGAAPGTCAR